MNTNLPAASSKAVVMAFAFAVALSAFGTVGCSGTGGPPELVGYGDGGSRSAFAKSGEVDDSNAQAASSDDASAADDTDAGDHDH